MNDTTERGARRFRNDDARGDSRKSESLLRAEARIRELRAANADMSDVRDKFWAPEPPDGWDYQWKVRTVYNMDMAARHMEQNQQGWTPVPYERHPEMMPPGFKGATIEREGLMLMERPMVFTQEARERERREAASAVRQKEIQLGVAPQGQFARSGQKITKGYEPIPADE